MFSQLHLRATPTRARLKTPHRGRTSLPFLSTSLTPPIIPLVLSLSSSSSPLARQRWWRSPVVGARRIGEYRESKTEATCFRRAFFLVSRALRSLERPESCARPPARGCPLPFTTPRSVSGYLCRSLSCKPFPFCSTHPTQNCTSPVFDHALSYHATPCHATLHRAELQYLHRSVSFVPITKFSNRNRGSILTHPSSRSGVSPLSFRCVPSQRVFHFDLSFHCTLDFRRPLSNYSPFLIY